VTSARRRTAIRSPPLRLEFRDQLVDRAHLDAGLARLGLGGLDDRQPRRDVDAVIGGVFSSSGFFFAFMMLGSEA
jgi:hypothetical protein